MTSPSDPAGSPSPPKAEGSLRDSRGKRIRRWGLALGLSGTLGLALFLGTRSQPESPRTDGSKPAPVLGSTASGPPTPPIARELEGDRTLAGALQDDQGVPIEGALV